MHRMGSLPHITTNSFRYDVARCLIGGLALVFLTAVCYRLRLNVATASLLYVIVIVLLSWAGSLISSIIVSVTSALCLAYLAPPAHSVRVDDLMDVVAVIAFLTTSLVIATLVSQLKKATQETLSSVNRRLVAAEEKERARIARDLHDDIGQRLALLVNNLEQLQQDSSGCPPEVRDCVAELHTETFKIATDIQVLSHELHSPSLEYLGLERAMKSFCGEFGRQQKCEIDFRGHLPSPPAPDISVSLLRVLQEALHNTAKHSGAGHVEVRLSETQGAIHLTVRDLGRGFNPEAAMKGGGLGLISMRERMKLVNGTFSIDSQAEHGATIHASVPHPPRSVLASDS
jgi:signal transduction histidine kinase